MSAVAIAHGRGSERERIWSRLGVLRVVLSVSPRGERVFVLGERGGALLTRREHDVLRLLGRGCANKEIAFELAIGRASVVRDVAALEQKLAVGTRLELALLAAMLDPSEPKPSVAISEIAVAGRAHYVVRATFSAHRTWATLSSSQREIVTLALSGLDGAQIARQRGTAERTIANQLASAFRKVGVSGRTAFATALLSAS